MSFFKFLVVVVFFFFVFFFFCFFYMFLVCWKRAYEKATFLNIYLKIKENLLSSIITKTGLFNDQFLYFVDIISAETIYTSTKLKKFRDHKNYISNVLRLYFLDYASYPNQQSARLACHALHHVKRPLCFTYPYDIGLTQDWYKVGTSWGGVKNSLVLQASSPCHFRRGEKLLLS